MRSNRRPAKIQFKSYSNRLLINIFDQISAVQSIVATISIRIRTIYIQYSSILYQKSSILLKIGQIWSKTVLELTIFDQNRQFLIKLD